MMKIEEIITALRKAVATYEVLSIKNKPGKAGKERFADFQKILYRIESRMVEPAEAMAWVYDFCERHGNKPPLIHCLLIELSKLFDIPLSLGDIPQEEVQQFKVSFNWPEGDEMQASIKVIQQHKISLDKCVNQCKLKLGANIFPHQALVKVKTIH